MFREHVSGKNVYVVYGINTFVLFLNKFCALNLPYCISANTWRHVYVVVNCQLKGLSHFNSNSIITITLPDKKEGNLCFLIIRQS